MADSYRAITGPAGPLARLEDFNGNSLTGYLVAKQDDAGPGRLTGADRDAWNADQGRLVYVVRSYLTPIGWVTDDSAVYVVQERFSVTTSKQQTYVGAWLGRGL